MGWLNAVNIVPPWKSWSGKLSPRRGEKALQVEHDASLGYALTAFWVIFPQGQKRVEHGGRADGTKGSQEESDALLWYALTWLWVIWRLDWKRICCDGISRKGGSLRDIRNDSVGASAGAAFSGKEGWGAGQKV